MEAFGADEESIQRTIESQVPHETTGDFIVNHNNWRAWMVFLRCAVQWRRDMMTGRLVGLDYGVVLGVLQFYKERHRPGLYDDMRLIERGVLEVMNG